MTEIDNYLKRVEKLINHLPMSTKAEILSLVKNRLEAEIEAHPSQSINKTLRDLGPEVNLVNEYLLSHGLSPVKKGSPFWKWFFIFTVGGSIIMIATVSFFFSKITPIIKVDEESGRVIMLGGLIDINGNIGSVKVGDQFDMDMKAKHIFNGKIDSVQQNINEVSLNFSNGKFVILKSEDHFIQWDCKLSEPPKDGQVKQDDKEYELNFKKLEGVQCDLKLPTTVKLDLEGANGNVSARRPDFPVDIKMDNGIITFHVDPTLDYDFNNKVINGTNLIFTSSVPGGIEVDLKLKNGTITVK